MTEDEVRDLLRRETVKAGSVVKWAKANGVHYVFVYRVLRGEKAPSEAVTKPLGLVKKVRWERAR